MREHCFWAGLTMKVTCKSSVGDHWWQYSVGSWGTSAKCVMGAGEGDLSNLFKGPRKSKLKVPVSSVKRLSKILLPNTYFCQFCFWNGQYTIQKMQPLSWTFLHKLARSCNFAADYIYLRFIIVIIMMMVIIISLKFIICKSAYLKALKFISILCVFLDTTTYSVY